MKILVVEDEEKIALSIKKGLELEGMAVDIAADGLEGYDLASTGNYDVVVLDLMLPELDGTLVCQRLRKEHNSTPILMLTARGQLDDKVEGLNMGADDYLVKPFAFDELLARIRALSRRPPSALGTILTVADLSLDPVNFQVKRGVDSINLSKKEFNLLEYLMRHSPKIMTKDQIIENVWNFDADILPNTVEVYIGYLRQKIDKPFPQKPTLIHTVRGFGYKVDPNHV